VLKGVILDNSHPKNMFEIGCKVSLVKLETLRLMESDDDLYLAEDSNGRRQIVVINQVGLF